MGLVQLELVIRELVIRACRYELRRMVASQQSVVSQSMSSDLMKRAQQALEGRKAAGPAQQNQSKDLLARAQAAIESSARQTAPAEARLPQGCDELMKLPVTCSARGVAYVVIAHRYGHELRIVGNELPQTGKGAGGVASHPPRRLSGEYSFDFGSWVCPLCSTGRGMWVCGCYGMEGALHCKGTTGGRGYCACGQIKAREFVGVDKSAVRGASGDAPLKTHTPGSATRLFQTPSRKQVTHGS